MRNEFPMLSLNFHLVKMLAYFFNTIRIADRNNGAGQFFRTKIKMVNGTPFIDD
jgi:hypothetical protein